MQRLVVGPTAVLHRPVLERLEMDVRVPSPREKVFASHPLDRIAALLVLGYHREIQYGVPEILSIRQAPVVVFHMTAPALQREFPEVRPETPRFHLDPLETHRGCYLTDGFPAGRVADATPKKPGHSCDQDDGDGGEPEGDSFDLSHIQLNKVTRRDHQLVFIHPAAGQMFLDAREAIVFDLPGLAQFDAELLFVNDPNQFRAVVLPVVKLEGQVIGLPEVLGVADLDVLV